VHPRRAIDVIDEAADLRGRIRDVAVLRYIELRFCNGPDHAPGTAILARLPDGGHPDRHPYRVQRLAIGGRGIWDALIAGRD